MALWQSVGQSLNLDPKATAGTNETEKELFHIVLESWLGNWRVRYRSLYQTRVEHEVLPPPTPLGHLGKELQLRRGTFGWPNS